MESYKIQFKITKKDFPKLKDEALQRSAVAESIKNGNASITLFEKTEDLFDYPEGSGNFPKWNNKINIDLFIEVETLLIDSIAENEEQMRQIISDNIRRSNALEYLYENESGRHFSFALLDVSEVQFAEFKTEKEKAKEKATKIANEQIDMFKKKSKSK